MRRLLVITHREGEAFTREVTLVHDCSRANRATIVASLVTRLLIDLCFHSCRALHRLKRGRASFSQYPLLADAHCSRLLVRQAADCLVLLVRDLRAMDLALLVIVQDAVWTIISVLLR